MSSSHTEVKCKLSPIVNAESQTQFKIAVDDWIKPKAITDKNGGDGNLTVDGDFNSYYYSSSTSCEIIYDFGLSQKADLKRIQIFPRLNNLSSLEGSKVYGSQDGSTLVLLFSVNNVIPNWNVFETSTAGSWKYRYFHVKHSECRVAEIKFFGVLVFDISGLSSIQCNISYDPGNKSLLNKVEYRSDKTYYVSSVSPVEGPSSGGTAVTINGFFDGSSSQVKIGSSVCNISAQSTTQILCTTTARTSLTDTTFSITASSGDVALKGLSFRYIDRWSDSNTWGGEVPPTDGEIAFVPAGQVLLVDDPAIKVSAMVVEGRVEFEDSQDMTFDANYILVRGGEFFVSSEANRRVNRLVFTMHGNRGDKGLPGFDNKVIAVQNGHIGMYGQKRTPVWTELSATAAAGATSITLIENVDWKAGEKIILAPTGRNKQEYDIRIVKSVSNNVVQLETALQYTHFAQVLTFDGKSFNVRGEVGLLTRNIVFKGDSNSEANKFGGHIMMRGEELQVSG